MLPIATLMVVSWICQVHCALGGIQDLAQRVVDIEELLVD